MRVKLATKARPVRTGSMLLPLLLVCLGAHSAMADGHKDPRGERELLFGASFGAEAGGYPHEPTSCMDLSKYNVCPDCDPQLAEFQCEGTGGSCTPYAFKPRSYIGTEYNNWCPAYMTTGGDQWQMDIFQYYKDISSYQAWCYKPNGQQCEDKIFVTHLCDGAGTQGGDCGGDNAYFEEFSGVAGAKQRRVSPCSTNMLPCLNFYHPGQDAVYTGYKCGWFRGFATSKNAGASFSDTMDVIGKAMGNGADYSHLVEQAAKADGWWKHPYANDHTADGFFIGGSWSWVCSDAGNDGYPFTGQQAKCFCNNEPMYGRTKQPYPPSSAPAYSTYTLCALHRSKASMTCSFYSYKGGNTMTLDTKTLVKDVELHMTSF